MSRRCRAHRVLAFVLCISTAAAATGASSPADAAPSQKESDPIKELMKAGREARKAGQHDVALEKFSAAWDLIKTPMTGGEYAAELQHARRYVEAREICGKVVVLPFAPADQPKYAASIADCQHYLDIADTKVAKVSAAFKQAVAEATVELDGKPRKREEVEQGVVIDPGEHKVVVRSGTEVREVTFTVASGEHRKLTIEFTPPPPTLHADSAQGEGQDVASTEAPPQQPAPAPPPPPDAVAVPIAQTRPAPSGTRTFALAGAGVGAALAGIGGILAISAKSKYDDATSSHCGAAAGGAPGQCTQAGLDLRAEARSSNRLGIGLVVAGGAVALGGLVLFALASPSSEAPRAHVAVSPFGILIRGSF